MKHTVRLIVALSSVIVPSVIHAQRPASADSVPRAGEWGAEAIIEPSGTGAALLRFWSRESALLIGAQFSVTHFDANQAGASVSGFTGTSTGVTTRLGVRRYRQSSTERLRPVLGVGARGGYASSFNDNHSWNIGAYGELGAVYFVVPHVSLGAVGEVQTFYEKQTQDNGLLGKIESTRTQFGASLLRVLLGVYF
jgi:hypothetical protein